MESHQSSSAKNIQELQGHKFLTPKDKQTECILNVIREVGSVCGVKRGRRSCPMDSMFTGVTWPLRSDPDMVPYPSTLT